MFKLGLKLWSTNENYLKSAKELFEDGVYDYIELYVIPNSYDFLHIWKDLNIPYVIHAPHFRAGVNLAVREKERQNIELINQAQKYADVLKSDKIIVHPGIAGDIKETARQLCIINDKRILVENKPYFALDDGLLCNGSTSEEIAFVIENSKVGFCLDIGHAICAANGHRKDYKLYLEEFMKLNPIMFHLSDGDINSNYDSHKHIGEGNFDIKYLLSILPKDAYVSIETEKDSKDNLEDFKRDIEKIKSIVEEKIILRFANIDDAKDVFEWRNDEKTRKASLNDDYIDYSSHLKWFNESLINKNRLIFIAENSSAKIGMVRFDIEGNYAKVSINLSPQKRGKGFGIKILRIAQDNLFNQCGINKFIAEVKDTNIASKKLFEKLGYIAISQYKTEKGFSVIKYVKE